ncbi:type I-E CRISPR-associated endonuclease Cas1e [Schaedlerella sp.]|uniref:type I-E CRISPR-associated endonuclease Cas1e n=1 Tax=Schaedlerella sp. TaxID=2676057 RepID=UPI003746A01E
MENKAGIEKPGIRSLPRIQDRMTFIYLERCRISRDNGSITVKDNNGITEIPAAAISVLLLGPGTDVTHRAMELIGDAGVTVIWVGEHGVRYYAYGRALTNHATLLLRQAQLVSNEKKHIRVARMMYQLRFPNEDVSKLTMQQLRGREGSRIRTLYREQSRKWNIPWDKRKYQPEDYESGDPVNQALSAGNACLYGLAHAVICALGCSPGLGFVHVGHELSFAYDIADLYKAEITIPIAFEMAAQNVDDIGSATRRRVRDELRTGHILDRMVHDIKYLLSDDDWNEEDYQSTLYLWDNVQGELEHGISYAEASEEK